MRTQPTGSTADRSFPSQLGLSLSPTIGSPTSPTTLNQTIRIFAEPLPINAHAGQPLLHLFGEVIFRQHELAP